MYIFNNFIASLLLLVPAWFANISEDYTKPNLQKTYKILFVGNSLSGTNDLPALFENKAKSKDIDVEVHSLISPAHSLEDHLLGNRIQLTIRNGHFDYVIIQQGPSPGSSGRDVLIKDGGKIQRMCKQAGSKMAYLMVWPSKKNYNRFDTVISSYTQTAKKNNAILIPAGQVWKDYIDATNDYSYYGSDGFNPSFKGSEVAAEVIFNTLFGK